MSRTIYIDQDNGTIVRDRGFTIQQPLPQFVVGDLEPLRIVILNGDGSLASTSGDGDLTLKVAIGDCAGAESGEWQIQYGSETPQTIPATADAEAMRTAIAAAIDTDPGNILVRAVAGEFYELEFIGALAEQPLPEEFTVEANTLSPKSVVTLQRLIAGDTGQNEIWTIRIKSVPLAFSDDWTPYDETSTGGDRGWEGKLTIADVAMYLAVLSTSTRTINRTFEAELTGPDYGPDTVCRQDASVTCEVITSGITTTPFAGPTLNQAVIESLIDTSITALNLGTMSQLPANALEEGFVLQASGTGLDPDIDGLRFYDTGETNEGQPIYLSEPTFDLISGSPDPVTFRLQFLGADIWQINIFLGDGTQLTRFWFKSSSASPIGNYTPSGTPAPTGTVTISSLIPQKRTTLGIVTGSDELDFPSLAGSATETETITVEGAIEGAACFAGPPANWPEGLSFNAAVIATDTVQIKALNAGSGAINPPAGTWQVVVFNPF